MPGLDPPVADLTGGNPNVLYELGLRHASGKITVQIGEHGRLPFDVTTIRTIQFVRGPSGYATAAEELRAALTAAFDNGMLPVTATRVFRRSDARITIERTILDFLAVPKSLVTEIEIASARARILERFSFAADESSAMANAAFAAQRKYTGLRPGEDLGAPLRQLAHEMQPSSERLAEDMRSLQRAAKQIDRALHFSLPSLRARKDRELVAAWKDLLQDLSNWFSEISALFRDESKWTLVFLGQAYAEILRLMDESAELCTAALRELERLK